MNAIPDEHWLAVTTRDASADGSFYYAVTTTGIFCRPSCPSRTAKRENLRIFATVADARQAGFRACLRCKPEQKSSNAHVEAVVRACRMLESSPTPVTLKQLADAVQLSTSHLHRSFKAQTGVTPSAYARGLRSTRLQGELENAPSVTRAIYEAGYNTSSRAYDDAKRRFGTTPGALKSGGTKLKIRFAVGICSLGNILVAQSEKGICAILLGEDAETLIRDLQDRFPQAELLGGEIGFEDTIARVIGFVEAPHIGLDLPLDIQGTVFQERVWQALRNIPAGKTVSYAQLARQIGNPDAVRAVAGACAANKIAVAIPCHRVVRSNGNLSGYRWGLERKKSLIEREAGSIKNAEDQNPETNDL